MTNTCPTEHVVRGLVLLLWLMAQPVVLAVAQGQTPIPKDFLRLADLRGSLAAEISRLEKDIEDIENGLPTAEDKWRFFQGQKAELDTLEHLSKRQALTAPQQGRVVLLRGFIEYPPLFNPDSLRARLAFDKNALAGKRLRADSVQDRILSLLSPEQAFKRTLSIVFAILIALVIGGFFSLAWQDQQLRERIFGGEAGIQFLTLFSLIIAIILFGITGILEGKELAALLGGLSGYILGRATHAPPPPSGGGAPLPPGGSAPPAPASRAPPAPAGAALAAAAGGTPEES